MTAHNHPILVKILESQASMRLSMGNWWSPLSRRRLTIHHQNSKKFLLGVAFAYSYPKLILPVQDGLTFMKQMKKPSMSSPIPQNLWAQNLFQLSYQFIKYPTTRLHPLLPRWMPVAVIEAKQISCSVVRIKYQFWGGCIAADAGAVEETQVKDYTSDVYHRVLGLFDCRA